MVKLNHVASNHRLHSHDVKYGSGGGSSGFNTVTGMWTGDDHNSAFSKFII